MSDSNDSYRDGTDVFNHTFSMEREGLVYIWNVETLWHKAQDLIVERFSVDDLLHECDSWVRDPARRKDLGRYLRVMSSDLNYPVILSPDIDLMDGNHRLAKAVETKSADIYGVRFPVLPDPDLIRVLDIP